MGLDIQTQIEFCEEEILQGGDESVYSEIIGSLRWLLYYIKKDLGCLT